jgi:FlaA1/EpsC-like NDP-sugar epimerase
MRDKLIIIGASGHGKVVADIAIKMNRWQNIAFLDDDESIKTSMGLEVIGKSADAITYKDEADGKSTLFRTKY